MEDTRSANNNLGGQSLDEQIVTAYVELSRESKEKFLAFALAMFSKKEDTHE
jgi:hypothetical protein